MRWNPDMNAENPARILAAFANGVATVSPTPNYKSSGERAVKGQKSLKVKDGPIFSSIACLEVCFGRFVPSSLLREGTLPFLKNFPTPLFNPSPLSPQNLHTRTCHVHV